VLAAANRMRRSADFAAVVRTGTRARSGALVLHRLSGLRSGPALVGLVVGRNVGASVVRHRVSRRLRAALRDRVELLPAGSGTVVRALPGAAEADSAQLAADLDAALSRLGTGVPR
jgi:ribonuclease P protein component